MIRAICELTVIICAPIVSCIYHIFSFLYNLIPKFIKNTKFSINYNIQRITIICIIISTLLIGIMLAHFNITSHIQAQKYETKTIAYDAAYWDNQLKQENLRNFEISCENMEAIHNWLFNTNSSDPNRQVLIEDINNIYKDIKLGYHQYYQPQCGYDNWDEDNRRMYERLLQDSKENQNLFLTLVFNGIIHGQVLRINSSGYSTNNYISFKLNKESLKNYMNTLVGNCLNLTYHWDYFTSQSQSQLYNTNCFTIWDGFYNDEEQEALGQLLDIQGLNNGYWINYNNRIHFAKINEEKLWWLSIDAYQELKKEYCNKYKYFDRMGNWNNTHFILNSRIMELAYVDNWTDGNFKLEKEFSFIQYDNIMKIYNKIKEINQ